MTTIFVGHVKRQDGYAIIATRDGEYRRHSQYISLGAANLEYRNLTSRIRSEGDDAIDWDSCDPLVEFKPHRFKLCI